MVPLCTVAAVARSVISPSLVLSLVAAQDTNCTAAAAALATAQQHTTAPLLFTVLNVSQQHANSPVLRVCIACVCSAAAAVFHQKL
jgi:hypothetical protein